MLEELTALAARLVELGQAHPEFVHPFEAAIAALERGDNPVAAFEAAMIVAGHKTATEAAARAYLKTTVQR